MYNCRPVRYHPFSHCLVSKKLNPPGVEDGMVVRVGGAGDRPLRGAGTAGDLLVRVNVSPSRIFQRQGSNLLQQVKIPLHTALLGGKARVPTLEGDVEVKVASGTQPGEECILKGRGVPSLNGGARGDMFVAFQVQIPR
jgi:molecular chaperone DnaJ